MNAKDIEIQIATKYFDKRINLIVPNASWGFKGFNECDLLIVTKSDYLIEVEIKISKADIKADLMKKHTHNQNYTRELYFAIPYNLVDCEFLIPKEAGIILVYPFDHGKMLEYYNPPIFARTLPKLHRKALVNKCAEKVSIEDKFKLARLGVLRMWNHKVELQKLKTNRL